MQLQSIQEPTLNREKEATLDSRGAKSSQPPYQERVENTKAREPTYFKVEEASMNPSDPRELSATSHEKWPLEGESVKRIEELLEARVLVWTKLTREEQGRHPGRVRVMGGPSKGVSTTHLSRRREEFV
ncbi:hypothetical protein CRG98_025535 [Punica granatum]|uniref:Uncharacterized protein n=1 Tax=Punica granatum TaxID=22663 RepID=A0A2I0JCR4_PUNGR|nr:hypothetical protein CRG98_025535 [Punica granatum]